MNTSLTSKNYPAQQEQAYNIDRNPYLHTYKEGLEFSNFLEKGGSDSSLKKGGVDKIRGVV